MSSQCCRTLTERYDMGWLARNIAEANLFAESSDTASFRVAAEPLKLDRSLIASLERFGKALHRFNQAVQELYFSARDGRQPHWVKEYLDMGKPDSVLDYAAMRRFRSDLPRIIRPDLILTEDGYTATELDSVPGGFGLTACLSELYSQRGQSVLGGGSGIIDGFAALLKAATGMDRPTTAIVVSDEAQDYLGEMQWLARALRQRGFDVEAVNPKDISFQEDGLYMGSGACYRRIHGVYRFFELFDLKNIPKIDLLLYAVRKQLAVITPPLKHFFEEKMLFALFCHPQLTNFWKQQLGEETYELLKQVFPQSWIVDNRPLPPYGVIPGLTIGGQAINQWSQLTEATKKERELVLKISGFSPDAWGSRGVTIGHDVSGKDWTQSLEASLKAFSQGSPYVLQRFHKGARVSADYFDEDSGDMHSMQGRVRLCPYYFDTGRDVEMAGVLATMCPLNKKLIHGMRDAIMVPVAAE